MKPNRFQIERSITIAAPAEVAFAQVNVMKNWEAWSPWDDLDPAMKRSYNDIAAGVGASYSWDGNSDVGEGTSTIVESKPNELVRMKLEFKRPFAGTNDVTFTFVPKDGQTVVTWGMTGEYAFAAKCVSLVIDCDKMVGDNFNKGLADLKRHVESAK
jgi:hypothetical protein